ELVESELFGYVRGAHSQAASPKAGIIEEAEGGTLFLDEIGDMAPELQTKLLRFTQDRQLIPVGGTRARRIDTRILAATSRTAPHARFAVGPRVTPAADRARAGRAHAPLQRQHAARRARARAQARAGLPLGQAFQAKCRRLPQERRVRLSLRRAQKIDAATRG